MMGRWSSDVYEIYCRMSMQSALGVGQAIASAIVTDVAAEGGFHEEHLELLPVDMQRIRDEMGALALDIDTEDAA